MVFISYAREDREIAQKLCNDLKSEGIEVWLDCEKILPGQNWKLLIKQTIKDSSYFLALLSLNSINKKGYVQKELKTALDMLDEFSSNEIFMIPIRLDDCEPVEEKLKDIHWIDLFESYKNALKELLRVLKPVNNYQLPNSNQTANWRIWKRTDYVIVATLISVFIVLASGLFKYGFFKNKSYSTYTDKTDSDIIGEQTYPKKVKNINITINYASIKEESADELGINLKNSLGINYSTERYETHLAETIIYYNGIHLKKAAIEISGHIPCEHKVRLLPKEQAENLRYKDIAIFLGDDYAKELIKQKLGGKTISLRSSPQTISKEDIIDILKKYNFYDRKLNNSGNFKGKFYDNRDGTVTDLRTNLIWHQSGSDSISYWDSEDKIKKYVDKLNSDNDNSVDYKKWRVPTIEELASLLENQKRNDALLYIDPLFDKKQQWCWSSDKPKTDGQWSVDFIRGEVDRIIKTGADFYVRAVRTED